MKIRKETRNLVKNRAQILDIFHCCSIVTGHTNIGHFSLLFYCCRTHKYWTLFIVVLLLPDTQILDTFHCCSIVTGHTNIGHFSLLFYCYWTHKLAIKHVYAALYCYNPGGNMRLNNQQNALLPYGCNSGYPKAPKCYIVRKLTVIFFISGMYIMTKIFILLTVVLYVQ
jgi:hypothetical protein